MPIEILAPAGGQQQLEAAVKAGADAVYLGLRGKLNARRGAENFASDELRDVVSMCHEAGTAVHVTLNTLLFDDETESALSQIEAVCKAGVDAVIVQDLGLASLIRSCAPDLVMHASTQMTVHNRASLETLRRLGFSRAVLARELSGKEIEEITKDSPIETEVFVHGALCMSVSGQCLFSSMLGARSGNRGMCAQPCRLPFVSNGFENCLSLKDMSHISYIPEFQRMGVASLKIEGRLKRPEYVAASVAACRAMRDEGKVPEALMNDLSKVFSRSGFTDGYYTAKRGAAMFGIRQKEDAADSATFASLHKLYRVQTPKIPLSEVLTVGETARLEVSDGEHAAAVQQANPAVGGELSYELAEKQLSRTGGTPYYLSELKVSGDRGAPPSLLNALRREALSKLSEKRRQIKEIEFTAAENKKTPHKKSEKQLLTLVFRSPSQIPKGLSNYSDSIEAVCLPLECLQKDIVKIDVPICAEAPRTLFEGEEAFAKRLSNAKNAGIQSVMLHNIGQVDMAKDMGFELHGGFSLNAVSTEAIEELGRLGFSDCELSFELCAGRISSLGGALPRKAVIYGRTPMMLTRNCPSALNGCTGKECHITDRRGIEFPVMCRAGASEVLNCVPLAIMDKNELLPCVDGYIMRFTTETAEECESIIEAAVKGTALCEERTKGLYFRTVL